MNAHDLALVMAGAILLGYLLIGAFFWRFWVKTRERLFLYFSAAFCLLALERVLILAVGAEISTMPALFVTRLIAFLVLIAGIWEANRGKSG